MVCYNRSRRIRSKNDNSYQLRCQESAYEKIIYFLSHFEDDVIIKDKNPINHKKSDSYELFFNTLRHRKLKIDKSVNIDNIMNEMNDGLS